MKANILLGLAIVLLALQAFRPPRNVAAIAPFTGKDDITVLYRAPPAVRQILADSCYDCHSNQTNYPWYAEIQPVGWWLASHIKDAKQKLNFAEFGRYSPSRQIKKLESLEDEVSDRTMPLKSYTLIHRGAKLTDAQVNELTRWAEDVQDEIARN
ncbi:MAG: heme-binding domain-containing protein [Opitutaceae bacterium]